MTHKNTIENNVEAFFYTHEIAKDYILRFKELNQYQPEHLSLVELEEPTMLHMYGVASMANKFSEYMNQKISRMNLPTSWIKKLNNYEQAFEPFQRIPLKIRIVNEGDYVGLGLFKDWIGQVKLDEPIIEHYSFEPNKPNYLMNHQHLMKLSILSDIEIDMINTHASRINDYLKGLFEAKDLQLLMVDLFYGRVESDYESTFTLASSFSPHHVLLRDSTDNRVINNNDFIEGKIDYNTYKNQLKTLLERLF